MSVLPLLIDEAIKARSKAYAPYSRFSVGAALSCEGGVYSGCNVENAAYPLGSCAEAGAISAMIMAGMRKIDAVVVVGGDMPCTPCGGCRQKLREFSQPNMKVYMVNPQGEVLLVRTLEELLPDSFGPDHLV
ncbi:cytidine deaminase [Neokomagataea thailandica]|uniref:Cytidine deaminase n=1 Tax=Neokomagataea tanensis NBRC 106556 TaxID=1223519 RepID=A0ABQ0QFZ6_9PROT|nr:MULTISPECIES: cytidine deaminase [Neokomagataea]GBR43335.1 cytidine deaminase [Neokomagataea tanensis NBRC 106556]